MLQRYGKLKLFRSILLSMSSGKTKDQEGKVIEQSKKTFITSESEPEPPKYITLKWLYQHVSIQGWMYFFTILVTAFGMGIGFVKYADVFRQLIKAPTPQEIKINNETENERSTNITKSGNADMERQLVELNSKIKKHEQTVVELNSRIKGQIEIIDSLKNTTVDKSKYDSQVLRLKEAIGQLDDQTVEIKSQKKTIEEQAALISALRNEIAESRQLRKTSSTVDPLVGRHSVILGSAKIITPELLVVLSRRTSDGAIIRVSAYDQEAVEMDIKVGERRRLTYKGNLYILTLVGGASNSIDFIIDKTP